MKFLEEVRTPGQVSGFHHRRLHRRIRTTQFNTVANRPNAMTHLAAAIPERTQNGPDERLNAQSDLRPKQHHHIDIGVWRQLSAAISAPRDNTELLPSNYN